MWSGPIHSNQAECAIKQGRIIASVQDTDIPMAKDATEASSEGPINTWASPEKRDRHIPGIEVSIRVFAIRVE
jgi:hypothetical protein